MPTLPRTHSISHYIIYVAVSLVILILVEQMDKSLCVKCVSYAVSVNILQKRLPWVRGGKPWEEQTRLSLLTIIIMSSERPSETHHIRKVAGSLKKKLSSLLHLSRAPTPSSIEMDSTSDNATRAR